MRIDNNIIISGENRTDASDLMSGLEAGDVIKAKVLESSPQEAVLRLSDGTVIKARTTESLDVKPGQTITLSVTSRTENSFVLETVKGVAKTNAEDTGRLQKMLEVAGIKPDSINLKLAAEFLKYSAAPTSQNITKALAFMKDPDGLDAEKAVYLTVKNINSGQAGKDKLSGLLNGDLKLGRLLESLYKELNSNGPGAGNQNAEADLTVSDNLSPAAGRKFAQQQTVNTTAAISSNSNTSNKPIPSEANPNNPQVKSSDILKSNAQSNLLGQKSPNTAVNESSLISIKAEADAADQKLSGTSPNSSETDTFGTTGTNMKGEINAYMNSGSKTSPDTGSKNYTDVFANAGFDSDSTELNEFNVKTASQLLTEDTQKPVFTVKSSAKEASGHVSTPDSTEGQAVSIKTDITKNSGIEIPDKRSFPEYSPEKALEKITDSIDKLYVNINKQLSAEELDSGSIKHKLSELAKELNLLQHSSTGSQAVNTQAASALNLVEDTVKLLDMFNSNNVLYYQIPVKIDSYRSTAELYVMKRNQNKKRIDPNDSVLFLSLDTKNMGRIETLLDVKGTNVSIGLRTENQAVSEFVRANIKHLYSGLSECGYKLADMRYSIIGAAASPAQQDKLLAEAVRQKHGKVDFRI